MLAITSGHRTISGQLSQLSVQCCMCMDGQNVRAKVEAQRRSTIFPPPPPKKRDVSLANFSISGRYPLHAEGVSAICAQMQKRLRGYVRVRVATAKAYRVLSNKMSPDIRHVRRRAQSSVAVFGPCSASSALCIHSKSADSAVCDIAVSALLLCISTRGCRFEFQKCLFFNYKIRAGGG